jgi:hypothetical protein
MPKGLLRKSGKKKQRGMTTYWLTAVAIAIACALGYYYAMTTRAILIGASLGGDSVRYLRNVTCKTPRVFHQGNCARIVLDNLFAPEDVMQLRALAERGMGVRPSRGGPTILDLNTGYLRDSDGLVNLFTDDRYTGLIQPADFELYRRVIMKLKGHVEDAFGLGEDYIFFTAPTFITRLDGRDSWSPKGTCILSGIYYIILYYTSICMCLLLACYWL